MASEHTSDDGLSTIGEIKVGAYIWTVVVFLISGTMAYNFAKYDRKLYDTKNKYINPVMHRENRTSSALMPNTSYDSRTDNAFTKTVERISK